MAGATLGERIREIRHDLRLTQAEFAPELGVQVIQVSRWEQGHQWPTLARLSRIAALGGYTLSEFFEGIDIQDAA